MTGVFSNFGSFGKVKPSDYDSLHINKTSSHIKATLKVYHFIDKDSKQYVSYIPAFEISGYGKTKAKSVEMLKFCVDDFFGNLIALSDKKMKVVLLSLGWHSDKFLKKNYSRAFVDQDGILQNFNPVDGKIKAETLEFAA